MDEFYVVIEKEGTLETIKTFGNGPLDIINDLVDYEWVDSIKSLIRARDQKIWDFTNEISFTRLRELKSKIKDQSQIQIKLDLLDSDIK